MIQKFTELLVTLFDRWKGIKRGFSKNNVKRTTTYLIRTNKLELKPIQNALKKSYLVFAHMVEKILRTFCGESCNARLFSFSCRVLRFDQYRERKDDTYQQMH